MLTARFRCASRFERDARGLGFRRVAGLDEAGRGSLFGPVFAAAVILSPERPIRGLNDSKLLEPERREELAVLIEERAVTWAVASADAGEIDRINIYQASRLAMRRAVEQLSEPADFLLVDALKLDLPMPQRALIHGDALPFDRGGVDSRQGPPGPVHVHLGPGLSPIWACPPQRLCDSRT